MRNDGNKEIRTPWQQLEQVKLRFEESTWQPTTFQIYIAYLTQGGRPENFSSWLKACYDVEEGKRVFDGKRYLQRISEIETTINSETGAAANG